VGVAEILVIPHPLQEQLSGEHLAWPAGQLGQQPELSCRQR
jgi:hypothetical protein